MKTRRSVLAAAALALVAALVPSSPASAVVGPYCDPGWTEVSAVFAQNANYERLPSPYIGSLCRGPSSQAMNVRLNMTGLPSTGSYTFWFYEVIGGQNVLTGKWDANLTPSSTIVNSPTYVPGTGNFVRASVLVSGVYSGSKTVTESVPTVVTTPKTAAQRSKAKKVRTKALKRAKSAYKAQLKLYKSKSSPGAKKAKRQYKRSVAAANATYRKAIAPSRTVQNVPTSRQEQVPPIGWSANGGYHLN